MKMNNQITDDLISILSPKEMRFIVHIYEVPERRGYASHDQSGVAMQLHKKGLLEKAGYFGRAFKWKLADGISREQIDFMKETLGLEEVLNYER